MPAPTITPLPTPPSRGDAPDVFSSRADAFLGAIPGFASQANDLGTYMDEAAEDIAELLAGGGFTGTSATSLATSVGSKTLTTQPNRSFLPGVFVSIIDTDEPSARAMYGPVTAYDRITGVVTVDVQTVTGSGTNAVWTVSLSGPIGPLPAKATGADLKALTDDEKYLTPKAVADAAAPVALNLAAPDLSNPTQTITLTANSTLGAPTNVKPGTTGAIFIKQDATGSRTLAYATGWKPFGSVPALTTTANAVDLLTWIVEAAGSVRFSIAKGGAA